jgi:hypothetical protein
MNYLLIVMPVLLVSACSKPVPFESAESLAANPERLRELRAQCKADHAKVGDAQCNAVAEATRKRFMGSGTPYTRSTSSAPGVAKPETPAPPGAPAP